MASTSHIRVFVQWKEPSVFSGEHIECLITFKNTASTVDKQQKGSLGKDNGQHVGDTKSAGDTSRPRFERQRTLTVTKSTAASVASTSVAGTIAGTGIGLGIASETPPTNPASRQPSYTNSHRSAHSLSVLPSSPALHTRSPSARSTPLLSPLQSRPVDSTSVSTSIPASTRPTAKHSRSLSILSMQGDSRRSSLPPTHKTSQQTARRPERPHARSASLQLLSSADPPSPALAFHSSRHPSPVLEYHASSSPKLTDHSTTPPLRQSRQSSHDSLGPDFDSLAVYPGRRRSRNKIASSTPAPATNLPKPDSSSPSADVNTSPSLSSSTHTMSRSPSIPSQFPASNFEFPPRSPGPNLIQPSTERLPTVPMPSTMARLLSDTPNSTSRASSDFYSLESNSSETAASDLATNIVSHSAPPPLLRQSSRIDRPTPKSEPEVLMMGYAQTVGSFVLDASLVNQSPFDQVKRKAVLGGQGGGGVVGVEPRSKRETGFFASLGWGNVGESLGDLLGGSEMSSIKEMRNVASTKTIPLLSTPQSVLFIDLRLAPGESKSYTYRFQLPRGLPPSHKGRAIKVNYHLKIAVQRSGSLGAQQNVNHIELPFRVLGSVNNRGESLGHDLMSPYILLHDRAQTTAVPTPEHMSATLPDLTSAHTSARAADSSPVALDDLLNYADRLIVDMSAGTQLQSPVEDRPRQRSSSDDTSPTIMKEAIDLAILRSNLTLDSDQPSQSTNRFTIARAGQTVAVLSIVRPAFRLGETVSGVVDFTAPMELAGGKPMLAVYSMNITLETVEQIDPSLALRSASSVQRATRKAYAHVSESVLFSRKTYFRMEIPTSATPTFETTGVQLSWRLRVEFVTARASKASQTTAARGLGIGATHDDAANDDQVPLYHSTDGSDLSEELLEEVSKDERGIVLIAKERLLAETFEVAVPIRVFGVAGLGIESTSGTGLAEALEI